MNRGAAKRARRERARALRVGDLIDGRTAQDIVDRTLESDVDVTLQTPDGRRTLVVVAGVGVIELDDRGELPIVLAHVVPGPHEAERRAHLLAALRLAGYGRAIDAMRARVEAAS